MLNLSRDDIQYIKLIISEARSIVEDKDITPQVRAKKMGEISNDLHDMFGLVIQHDDVKNKWYVARNSLLSNKERIYE